MTEQDSIEHHVSMTIQGLFSSVSDLTGYTMNGNTRPLVAADRTMIEASYHQLGRLLERLPEQELEAAE